MLGALIADQRMNHGFFARFNAGIPQPGQRKWISLTGHYGVNDRGARDASNIVNDMMNLEIHLRQRLMDGWICWSDIPANSLRCRISDRTAQTRSSGRNAARNNPTECRYCSH